MSIAQTQQGIGRFTCLCRWICSGLLCAPLLYWWSLAYRADAVVLLVLALLSLVAGIVLFGNSILCLSRHRYREQRFISLFFLLLSVAGVLAMTCVLPGWKM